jgi:hypothetical protein
MTKFQDELLSIIANYESNQKCQAIEPQHSLLKASRSKMDNVIVDNYKSPCMMKWDCDLVLGLQNWQIIKPKI